jgi:hypothetical protein
MLGFGVAECADEFALGDTAEDPPPLFVGAVRSGHPGAELDADGGVDAADFLYEQTRLDL